MSEVGQPVKHQALYYRAADIYYILKTLFSECRKQGKTKNEERNLASGFHPSPIYFWYHFLKRIYILQIGDR